MCLSKIRWEKWGEIVYFFMLVRPLQKIGIGGGQKAVISSGVN
jgi:hypothetical protein